MKYVLDKASLSKQFITECDYTEYLFNNVL